MEIKAVMLLLHPSNLKVKGKMASLTENRRLSGEMIVWPLKFELDRPFFYSKRISGQKRLRIWKMCNTEL